MAETHPGNVREHNEDAFFSSAEEGLALIADGMGGHAAGEVASEITVRTFKEIKPSADNLVATAMESHQRIVAHAEENVESRGMGSALVAAKFEKQTVTVCWVGDSRAYIFNEESGLQPLTSDHSYVQWLLENGQINEHQARIHPDRNLVTQCLGVSPPDPEINTVPWQYDDIVLLCSDGLTDELDDEGIEAILRKDQSLEAALQLLMYTAIDNGGKDNISIALAQNKAKSLSVNPANMEVGELKTTSWVPIAVGVGSVVLIAAAWMLIQSFVL